MKKYFFMTSIFTLTFACAFGQTNKLDSNDIHKINFRTAGDYFIDGFRVYTKLTKVDSVKILKESVSKLNGKWTSTKDKYIYDYDLSHVTFKGTLYKKGVMLQSPFVRLEIIHGQIKIIYSSTIGDTFIDSDTFNFRVSDKELVIDDYIYHRQKINKKRATGSL